MPKAEKLTLRWAFLRWRLSPVRWPFEAPLFR
jgi:hypothetical protein